MVLLLSIVVFVWRMREGGLEWYSSDSWFLVSELWSRVSDLSFSVDRVWGLFFVSFDVGRWVAE